MITFIPVAYGRGQWAGYFNKYGEYRGFLQIDSEKIQIRTDKGKPLTYEELSALLDGLKTGQSIKTKIVELVTI